ncbi:hypothetical protein Plec18167_000140 [Paecilomyces lecythidis]|uniref:Ankyrin repeat protein n=1 Tax=Paecilomyces lecythidis TaxID=3004212 RepID=A0ABR3YE17_9EURO
MKEDRLPERGLDFVLLPDAARNGQADVLRYLFDTLPDCQRPFPWTPWTGYRSYEQFCLPFNYQKDKLHRDRHLINAQYNLPMHALEASDAPAIIKVLLDYGMSVNQYINSTTSLLWKAVEMKKCDVVELLLDHGADTDSKRRRHILIEAIKNDDPDTVASLIKHGASAEETNAFGYALTNRRIASVRKLLELGADINGMSAMRHSRKGLVFKVRAPTPLHRVIGAHWEKPGATCSREEMVRFLLINGAKTDIVYARCTPFVLARYKRRRGIVEVFREFGIEE